MGKLKTNQKGFSAIEVILILVVVCLIGFVGWYVLHAKNNIDKSLTSNTSTNPIVKKTTTKSTTPTQPTDPYAGWRSYESKLEKISIKYPSDWTVTSNGDLFGILNNTSQEENFSLESSAEKLATGKLVRANVRLNTATSGLSAGACHGLVVHFAKPITVSGRNLTLVALDSYTAPGNIIGIYVTDEQGLSTGSTTSTCQPSFASLKGNSNVFVNASFTRPPQPGDHSDGASIELTEAEYTQSSVVQQELKALESLTY